MEEINLSAAPQLVQQAQLWASEYGLRFLSALAIYIVGRWFARTLKHLVVRAMNKARIDANLVSFLGNLTFYGITVFVILAVLGQLGIATTSLIAVIGAAGLAVGLALQGSLSNFAAGLLIVFFHPFRVGDTIEGNGVMGVVEDIQILATVVRSFDNKIITIPNSSLTNNNITNHSARGMVRVDLVVRVPYCQNIDQAKEAIHTILEANPHVLREPAPVIGVQELTESSIVLTVSPWTAVEHSQEVTFATYEQMARQLDEARCLQVNQPAAKRSNVHVDVPAMLVARHVGEAAPA